LAVVLAGEPAARIVADVSDRALREDMDFNLNAYWARKCARSYLFLFDVMVDFGVTTLPRILWTLETGEIISKPQGVRLVLERYPEWRSLAEEVLGRCEDASSITKPETCGSRRAVVRAAGHARGHG